MFNGSVLQSTSEGSSESSKFNKKFTGTLPSDDELIDKISKGIDPYLEYIDEARIRTEEKKKQDPTFYCEIHHIVPKFDGGGDEKTNLVLLGYNEHAIAHYIRWVVYQKPQDLTAFNVMSGQSPDARRERAILGGKIGGPIVQKQNKERGVGWFSSEKQSELGKRGAAVNREQGTGGYDPANLEKANQVLRDDPEKYRPQQLKNLAQGRETQKEKGINLGNPDQQRLKSLKRFDIVVLNGKEYSINTEHRIYVCETTLDYYLRYAPRKKKK